MHTVYLGRAARALAPVLTHARSHPLEFQRMVARMRQLDSVDRLPPTEQLVHSPLPLHSSLGMLKLRRQVDSCKLLKTMSLT